MSVSSPPSPFIDGVAVPWTREGIVNPYPWFVAMLRERPVAYDELSRVWHVLSYQGVQDFLRDHDTFSTAARLRNVPPAQRVIRLLTSDPPQHVGLRAKFAHAYRPRRVAAMEGRIREVARGLLEAGIARGRFDAVAGFALPLTLIMICEIIGIPPEEQDEFARNAGLNSLGTIEPPANDGRPRMTLYMGGAADPGESPLDRYLQGLIARRRAAPQDDLVSDLARIPEGELVGKLDVGALLGEQLGAGQNTTVHLISSMLALLAEHPGEAARLRADPRLAASAVEESVRIACPLQARPRVVTRPARLGPYEVGEGETVLAWLQSANLDPEVFTDPERYDIARQPNHHISFGYGEHYCLGSSLARMEARVALEEWFAAVADYEIAAPPVRAQDFILRGLASLPVAVVPA